MKLDQDVLYFHEAARAKVFSAIPSGQLELGRLIAGQTDYWRHDGVHHQRQRKTLIFNDWRSYEDNEGFFPSLDELYVQRQRLSVVIDTLFDDGFVMYAMIAEELLELNKETWFSLVHAALVLKPDQELLALAIDQLKKTADQLLILNEPTMNRLSHVDDISPTCLFAVDIFSLPFSRLTALPAYFLQHKPEFNTLVLTTSTGPIQLNRITYLRHHFPNLVLQKIDYGDPVILPDSQPRFFIKFNEITSSETAYISNNLKVLRCPVESLLEVDLSDMNLTSLSLGNISDFEFDQAEFKKKLSAATKSCVSLSLDCEEGIAKHPVALVGDLNHLHQLTLYEVGPGVYSSLPSILKSLTQLRSLRIISSENYLRMRNGCAAEPGLQLDQLRKLEIKVADALEEEVMDFVQACVGLEQLDLIGGDWVFEADPPHLPKLTHFKLSHESESSEFLENFIKVNSSLIHMQVMVNDIVNLDMHELSTRTIRSLYIQGVDRNLLSTQANHLLHNLAQFSHLEILVFDKVRMMHYDAAENIAELANKLNSLRYLGLNACAINLRWLASLISISPKPHWIEFDESFSSTGRGEGQPNIYWWRAMSRQKKLFEVYCQLINTIRENESQQLARQENPATSLIFDAKTKKNPSASLSIKKRYTKRSALVDIPCEYYRVSVFNCLELSDSPKSADEVFVLRSTDPIIQILTSQPSRVAVLPANDVNDVNDLNDVNDAVDLTRETHLGHMTLTISAAWTPIPALSSQDKILVYQANCLEQLEWGYDQLTSRHCVRWSRCENQVMQSVDVSFVVAVPKVILSDPPIYENEIQFYRSFGGEALDCAAEMTVEDYLQAIKSQKQGACRHRAVAFFYDLCKKSMTARLVVNELHAFVECRIHGTWYRCDLGGHPALSQVIEPLERPQISVLPQTQQKAMSEYLGHRHGYFQLIKPCLMDYQPSSLIHYFIDQPIKQRLWYFTNQIQSYAFSDYLAAMSRSLNFRFIEVLEADDLSCARARIKPIGDIGIVEPGPAGPFYDFIQAATGQPGIVFIQAQQWRPQDFVKWNSLFDAVRQVDGVCLPDSMQIVVALNESQQMQADFLSRMHRIEPVPSDWRTPIQPLSSRVEQFDPSCWDDSVTVIPLYQAQDWQRNWLGQWELDGSQLIWRRGAMASALENQSPVVVLLDPPWHDRRFQHAVLGMEDIYQAQSCPDWGRYSPILINPLEQITAQAATEIFVLQQSSYAELFQRYEFDESQAVLRQAPGYLFHQSDSGLLRLLVVESLTDMQWRRLLDHALLQQRHLYLETVLGLGSSVVFPEALSPYVHVSNLPELKQTYYVQASDDGFSISLWRKQHPDGVSISITQLPVVELFESYARLGSSVADHQGFYFSRKPGVLASLLANHSAVLLYGDWDQEQVRAMWAYLVARQALALGNLYLMGSGSSLWPGLLKEYIYPSPSIADKQACFKQGIAMDLGDFTYAQCQSMARYLARHEGWDDCLDPRMAWHGLRDGHASVMTLDAWQDPSTMRQLGLELALSDFPFVMLVGKSGVGKTHFVRHELKKSHPGMQLFEGIDQLSVWARADFVAGEEEWRILFIDEANIGTQHWMNFASMVHNQPAGLVIDQAWQPLSPYHKVIFSMNPQRDGGERHLPALFERYPQVMVFEPMPLSSMLNHCIGPIMASLIKSSAERASFVHELRQHIEDAQHKNPQHYWTPRDLAAIALLTMAALDFRVSEKDRVPAVLRFFITRINTLSQAESKSESESESESGFIPALNLASVSRELSKRLYCPKNREPVLAVLSACFRLRRFRQTLSATSDPELLYAGLAGVLLEGEPGIGKSELVLASLAATGHVLNQDYVVLPVTMAIDEKLRRLDDAFHRGQIVVIDEINSASMLEESLNQYLSAYDLQGRRPRLPGFMILATQNPVSFAGRARMSVALEKRFLKFCLPAYSNQDMQMILQQKGYQETPTLRFADLFTCYDSLRLSRGLCFRDVLKEAERQFPRAANTSLFVCSSRGQKRRYDSIDDAEHELAKIFA
jgi:hypothetical protein